MNVKKIDIEILTDK